jgi:zinc/manganese transport system substrate-binding protein/manganese/iron transport system substrate-binding protein
MRALLLPVVLLALASVGCGEEATPASEHAALDVVATTTQAADLARNVAGTRAHVHAILPAGADPHDYELRPSDVDALAEADVIVRSGGDLDEWLADAVEAAGSEAPVVDLIDHVARRAEDPHWWHDPRNALAAVDALRDAFARADPEGAPAYRDAAKRYQARIRALDEAVAACLAKVPAAQRRLVTTHDSLGYYADRYGIEVTGAVIPSLSTQAQASAG